MNKIIIPVLASVLVLSFGLTQDAFANYEVIDLGFTAEDINDSGQIVGFDPSTLNGVIWEDGVLTPISENFNPKFINEVGQIAGFQFCTTFPTGQCPAIWDSENGVQLLETLPDQHSAFITGINDSGVVIGSVRIISETTNEQFAVLWDPVTGIQEIGNFDGQFSRAEQINNAGQIVLRHMDSSGVFHESFWENGVVTEIAESNFVTSLNEAGQVTLRIGTEGFVWDKTNGFQSLGDLGLGVTSPFAINDLGQVVGNAIVGDDGLNTISHAFIWDSQNGIQDLGTLTGGPFETSIARDINNSGQSVGSNCPGASFCFDFEAVTWNSENEIQGLDPLTPGESYIATQINEAGQILGVEGSFGNGPSILWNPTPDFDSLRAQILSLGLDNGIENALISKVDAAEQQFNAGNFETAINILNAYVNQAEAQTGKKIAEEDAAALIESADVLIDFISNQIPENTPPTIESVTLTQNGVDVTGGEADLAEPVECNANGVNDADGDLVTLSFEWSNQFGTVITTDSTLPADFPGAAASNLMTCTVTPFDGTDFGDSVSSSVTVESGTGF